MRWRWYHSLGLAMVLLSPSGGPGVGAPPGFKPKPIIDTQVFIFTMHATHYRAMGLDKRLAAGATTLARGKLRGLHVEVMNHPASVQVQLPRLRGGAGRPLFTRDWEGVALEVLADIDPAGKDIHLSVTRFLPGGNLRLTVAGELEPGRLLLVGGWPVPDGERGRKVAFLVACPRVVRR